MNKLGKKFIVFGILLIFISLILLVYNTYKEYNANKKSQEVLNIMKNNLSDKDEVTNIDNLSSSSEEMLTINVGGFDYIGMIKIPVLNLELPVMSEYDYTRLDIAPCRYYGSLYTNDLIICAHSYKTHFLNIINLSKEDIIIFQDVNGKDYLYEVLEIEILNPKEVSKMIDNDFDLTLYTCTEDGMNRVTVRCNKILDETV